MTTTTLEAARAARAATGSSSEAPLIRLSGLGLVIAGLLIVFFPILHPDHDAAGYASAIWVPVHLMPAGMAVLALFGLMGIYARQGERRDRFGSLSFIAAVLGTTLLLTGTVEKFMIPFIGLNAPQVMEGPPPIGQLLAWEASGLVFAIGYLLQGIAIFRTGVLPRGAGVLLGVSGVALGVVSGAAGMVPPVLFRGALGFGLALAWLGSSL